VENIFGQSGKLSATKQTTGSDCAAACLHMILSYFGRYENLDTIQSRMRIGRDGVSASDIVHVAAQFGIRMKGFKIDDPKQLFEFSRGTILHWDLTHYVVLDRATKSGIYIMDPAIGRRFITWTRVFDSLTGVILQPEMTSQFIRQKNIHYPNTRRRVLHFFSNHTSFFIQLLLASLILQCFSLAAPILTSVIVDQVVPIRDYDYLNVMFAGGCAMAIMMLAGSFSRGKILLKLRIKLDGYLSAEFFEHLLSLPAAFYLYRSSGDLVMRLNSNSEMREILSTTTMTMLLDGMMAISLLIVISVVDINMGILVVCLALCRLLVYYFSRAQQESNMAAVLASQAKARSFEFRLINSITSIKANGKTSEVLAYWFNLFHSNLSDSARQQNLDTHVKAWLETFAIISPIVVLYYGAKTVLAEEQSLGTMLALSAMASAFLQPLNNLVNAALQLKSLSSYMERLEDVFKEAPESRNVIYQLPKLDGHLELHDVHYCYPGQDRNTLEFINLSINSGSFVAIVGASGSGKSTLLSLLAGLHEISSGKFLIDSHDHKQLDIEWYRKRIGYVPQDPSFFDGTIDSNIRLYHPDLTHERMQLALKLSTLSNDLREMPQGINTYLSDGGRTISGGQRQRLAISIALASQPDILFFDEATSALDSTNEKVIFENLSRIKATRIVVAHRLSTIRDADKIIVMNKGRIVECGKHEELIRLGKTYYDLVKNQIRMTMDNI